MWKLQDASQKSIVVIFPFSLQHKCYIVATCDRDLKRRIRKIPGVPIMYISQHRYSIERMPDAFGGERDNSYMFVHNFLYCSSKSITDENRPSKHNHAYYS